ncbi:Hypothetical protein A7982_09109 [Minicystis rosea]|nr:Hypothetical protein A7982_09109 [Minicystis rosea]
MKRNTRPETVKIAFFATVALGAAIFSAPACGGEGNPTPPTTASSGTGDTTSSSSSGGGGGAGGATASSSSSGGGTGGAPNCDGPNGCFSCSPTKTVEFLNACTDAQCSPFDNVARLPLYNNGNLPSVP